MDNFRAIVGGWSPGHKVVSTFGRFEWIRSQAEFFGVWVRQDWFVVLELSERNWIQSNNDCKERVEISSDTKAGKS